MDSIIEYYRTIDQSANKLVELFTRSVPLSVGSANAAATAAKEKINESKKHAVSLTAGDFHFANHFYPKVSLFFFLMLISVVRIVVHII